MYVTADKSLPRSLDVQISLSATQTESRTDLSILCVALEDLGLLPNVNRVRFYSSIEAVETDFASGTEAYRAASAFFDQDPKPTTMALAEVFTSDLPARMVAGAELTAAEIAAIAAITTGSMVFTYDKGTGSTVKTLTGLTFTGVTTQEGIATILGTALGADFTCSVITLPGGTKLIEIKTVATGGACSITYPSEHTSGAYVGTLLKLTSATAGQIMNGYTYVNIADELSSVANAANAVDKFIYGWCLGSTLRDAAIQAVAAEWVLARTGFMTLVTNDVSALSSSYDDDIGCVVNAAGNRRVAALYHDNAQRYPDVSILAYMLSVNYQLKDSTVTAKFKILPGIETVQLTETEWAILQSKGYNTYTAIGNDARTFRDGNSESSGWFMDTVINLDNFIEDLSVNVFNVFLRNKKIPYTSMGQMLLVDACRETGNQYTFNGSFADREIADTSKKSGTTIVPAVQVLPTPISSVSAASRASRIGPPINMVVQDAGAMHSIAIAVELVS